jgi:hypothetical protein
MLRHDDMPFRAVPCRAVPFGSAGAAASCYSPLLLHLHVSIDMCLPLHPMSLFSNWPCCSDLPGQDIARAREPQRLWVDHLTGLPTMRHDLTIDRGASFEHAVARLHHERTGGCLAALPSAKVGGGGRRECGQILI